MTAWDINQSRSTYNITHWGGGYFDINDEGHAVVSPEQSGPSNGIDLFKLTGEIKASGLSLPVLVRIPNIIHKQVMQLNDAFTAAMDFQQYRGGYTSVYPIKVNQQRSVVEEIISVNDASVGLEAGSKPELMAVLAMADSNNGVIVCNGYKDREYIRLALIGKQLGHKIYIVIEKLSELELIIEESASLGIDPLLGVRIRLASIGKGKWQNTGGEKSKFGFSASKLLDVISRLRGAGLLDTLLLLHFHLGSQIPNIRDIQKGLQEVARYYVELCKMDVNINCIDVGGGLGIDYEGSRSRSSCSINYTVQEYANNVVHALAEVCEEYDLPHPDIITESGRALTAHHAVLITDVVDVETVPDLEIDLSDNIEGPAIVKGLFRDLQNISERSAIETYHDAVHWISQAQDMYTHGVIKLEDRARAEQIYYAICREVSPLINASPRNNQEIIDDINEKLADKYFCNFSIFQSIPDVWAIEQVFPVMPLHRLDEEPVRRAIISDITCDSDGCIDHYVDKMGVESTLPLHQVSDGELYLLGIFLVGAYQEILGDLHNLFGDTNSVNVSLAADGGYRLEQMQQGDTVEDVLAYVKFNSVELLGKLRTKTENSQLDDSQRAVFLEALESGLTGYTYLEE
ncbi:MAG: biosynthetic arginine decarboxylase [Gammaproteobacteria bacterium]